jgi:hypothetical protein
MVAFTNRHHAAGVQLIIRGGANTAIRLKRSLGQWAAGTSTI